MGNKANSGAPDQKITENELDLSINYLITNQSMYFTKDQLKEPIMKIMLFVKQNYPFDHSSGFLKTSSSLIKMFFHPNFPRQMMKVLKLFIQSLEEINKKSLTFIKVNEIASLSFLANFIVFASSEKITSTFDSLLVRTDIDPANKQLIKKLEEKNEGQLEIIGNLAQKMSEQEKQGVQKVFRVTLMKFINLRNSSWSPSNHTLKHFEVLEGSIFMLYCKMHFSNYSPDFHTPSQKQSYKSNVTIGSYFLSAGTSRINPSIYEAAVVFLYSILKLPGLEHSEIKALPSHYFKNLPIITSISIYQYTLCNILFSLKYITEGSAFFIRFAFNRILSLKLVQLLLKQIKSQQEMITFYLQELCLQVKVGQIQRACLCQIVKLYDKLDGGKSEVFNKFIENGNIKYNLKFADKEIKVNPIEVVTELEDEKDTCSKEFLLISEKFLYEKVFFKEIQFNLNDRSLWSQILPGIMNNKEDEEIRVMSQLRGEEGSSGEEAEEEQMVEERGMNEVGMQEGKEGKGETEEKLK